MKDKNNQKNTSTGAHQTGWGKVAQWYDSHLQNDDTYHAQVVVPNLIRLINLQKTESLLELGCGQGFVIEKFLPFSKKLTGVDIGKELIEIAQKNHKEIVYVVGSAEDPQILKGQTFDVITIVLAIQNMKHLSLVVENISRLLAPQGRVYLVLNHPAFRIPQHTTWMFSEDKKTQMRVVDLYMSEKEISIDMNPGQTENKKITPSFHRPLQVYSKAFAKQNFAITKIEEWMSHKTSQPGPQAEAENKARKEFPMFMCLELKKV
jgi:ubiquinone/menaquinone biosynthesis C-methylase UbiE